MIINQPVITIWSTDKIILHVCIEYDVLVFLYSGIAVLDIKLWEESNR
jgi:hypothetical protein